MPKWAIVMLILVAITTMTGTEVTKKVIVFIALTSWIVYMMFDDYLFFKDPLDDFKDKMNKRRKQGGVA